MAATACPGRHETPGTYLGRPGRPGARPGRPGRQQDPDRGSGRARQAVEERFQGELLGDVEVEAAARVLDGGGTRAGPGRVGLCRLGAKKVEAVAGEDDLLGARGERRQVAQPERGQLEAEVEDFGAATPPGPFGAVGDVFRGPFEAGL